MNDLHALSAELAALDVDMADLDAARATCAYKPDPIDVISQYALYYALETFAHAHAQDRSVHSSGSDGCATIRS